jgi:hypothetical protein
MKAALALILIVLIFPAAALAQRCGFDVLHQQKMLSDPAYRAGIEEQQTWIRNYIRDHRDEYMNLPQAALYTIPVVVHVVHTGGAIGTIYNPSDATIQSAIDYLNQVYDGTWPGTQGVGEIQINFVLANRDPSCNPTTGINRVNGSVLANYTAQGVNAFNTTGVDDLDVKNLSRWDTYRYYNIWVVNRIDGRDGTSGSFVGGFADFPGAPPNSDGTVILATQMQPNRKTLPHELGHAFSLYHPFEGSSGTTCPANADCTQDGDEVCDTDPITQPAGFVCRTGANACTGTPYSINTEHNYMNYTNCATLFTADQKARMLAAAAGIFRRGLHTSWGRSATYPVLPFTPPIAASCTPVSGATGLAGGFAGLLNLSLAGRHYNSGTTQEDLGYVPANTCLNLVPLVPGNTYTIDLNMLGQNREQVRAWIDYNNNGVFDNATEQIFYQGDIGPPSLFNLSTSGTFTVPPGAPINTLVRMRVIDEVSVAYSASYTINNACYNPVYGQAEDYPVWLGAAVVLPVTYRSFRAAALGEDVRVEWETATETGSSHFVVERSADGRRFDAVGHLPAKGQAADYRFTDRKPGQGTIYYRLRQIDVDGGATYSRIISVQLDGGRSPSFTLQSTVVNHEIRIRFERGVQPRQLRLIDLSGRVLLQRSIDASTSQVVTIALDGLQMPAGIYLLEILDGTTRHAEKILRQ